MRRNSMRLLLAALPLATAAPAADLKVDGAGLWRNRDLRLSLKRLLDGGKKAPLDENALEDAAVIPLASLGDEGFQAARIEIDALLSDGTRNHYEFDPTFAKPLPRPL